MKKINNIEIIILIFLLSIISFLLYNYFNTKYKNRIEKFQIPNIIINFLVMENVEMIKGNILYHSL